MSQINYKEVLKNQSPRLLTIFATVFILVTLYEIAKETFFPDLTKWESHIITIIFSSFAAVIGSFLAITRIEILRQRLVKKLEQNKSHEREVEKYAKELVINQAVLEEKTSELTILTAKLKKSKKELKKLNKSKDKFFAILAHDLRGPFTVFKGLPEFLLRNMDDVDKDELKESLEQIVDSADRVYKLLTSLLDWSKVQLGVESYNPIEINLLDLINEIEELIRPVVKHKNHNFQIKIEPSIVISADKEMISTVVRNLVSNAIKFTPDGKDITVTAAQLEDEVIIKIIDDGVGITKENLSKLFDRNVMLTTKGTKDEKGYGLGLILCKELVKINGGTIWAESDGANGAEFCFTLPSLNR